MQKGINDLNTLLMHRYQSGTFQPLTATSQEAMLDTVLNERRKELIMRGLRWPDIKRLNKEDRNITPRRTIEGQIYTLTPNANRYALPIPIDIIQLTGIQQNP